MDHTIVVKDMIMSIQCWECIHLIPDWKTMLLFIHYAICYVKGLRKRWVHSPIKCSIKLRKIKHLTKKSRLVRVWFIYNPAILKHITCYAFHSRTIRPSSNKPRNLHVNCVLTIDPPYWLANYRSYKVYCSANDFNRVIRTVMWKNNASNFIKCFKSSLIMRFDWNVWYQFV